MYDTTVDTDTLRAAAEELLTRPSDAAFWDERLYTTHGPVYSWADRGDDVLAESNFRTILEELQGVAEEEEHVFSGSVGHWLVGSLQQIYVQVYDEQGEYTAAFVRAVEIAEELKDYPVFDEDDYSRREWEAFEETLEDALNDAERRCDDEIADELEEGDVQRIREEILEEIREGGSWCTSDEVDYGWIETRYEEIARETVDRALEGYARSLIPSQPETLLEVCN